MQWPCVGDAYLYFVCLAAPQILMDCEGVDAVDQVGWVHLSAKLSGGVHHCIDEIEACSKECTTV